MSVTQTNTQRFSVDEITARPMRSLTLPKMDRVFDGTSTNISKHERTLTPSTVASSSWSPNRLLGLLSFESDDDIETADESIHFELTPRAVSDTNLSTVHKSFDHHDIEHEKRRWCRDLMKSCDTPRAWNCSATRKSYDNFARGDNNEIDSAEIKNLSGDVERNISDVGLCKPCTTGEEKYLSSSSSHISQPFLFWNGYALLKHDQMEDYQQRDYIVGGYRPTMLFRDAIRTFVHIHNESGNIWSHAIATICTAIMFAFWLRDNHHTAKLDVFYFGTMCAHFVTLVCLFFSSTTYHLFTCSCRRVSRCFLEMDSIMIVMVLYSSYLSFLAGFPCSDMFRRNCIILASIFVVLMVSVRLIPDSVVSKLQYYLLGSKVEYYLNASCSSQQGRQDWIKYYSLMLIVLFCALGLILPTTLMIAMNCEQLQRDIFIKYYIGGAIFQTAAIAFLITGFPEKWYPEKFDYFLSSHQVWHILIWVGLTLQLRGATLNYELRFASRSQDIFPPQLPHEFEQNQFCPKSFMDGFPLADH